MAIFLNDYIVYSKTKTNDTRVVIFPSTDVGAQIVSYHKNQGHNEVVVGKLLDNAVGAFPMPGEIIKSIKEVAKASKTHSYVVGIDAYLLLLEATKAGEFYTAVQSIVDENKVNVSFILSANTNIQSVFSNPKYSDGMQVIALIGAVEATSTASITLIPAEWGKNDSSNISGLKGLLSILGNLIPQCGDYIVAMQTFKDRIAGLSNFIAQILSPQDYLKQRFGFDGQISETTAKLLLLKFENLIDGLVSNFVEENINPRLAVKRLLEIDEDLWQASAWMLCKRIPTTTYLFAVLSQEISKNVFLRNYVVESAVKHLGVIDSARYAKERADALIAVGDDAHPLICEFVLATRSLGDLEIVPWFNVGIESEKEEIVRRASNSDMTVGLHKIYAEVYPALDDYLSSYSFNESVLTTYFSSYRKFKVQNTVTAEFAEIAGNASIPSSIISRNVSLQKYYSNTDTALLIVDGLGAEYFPLLLGTARRKGLNIAYANLVYVELPSSTEFNKTIWQGNRKLPEIKEVDNIAHNGAAKHEKNPSERNLVATFDVVTNDLIKQISIAFSTYKRVIVTADHGSTRLAVLAHNSRIGKTIQYNGVPDDWRFCRALMGQKRPEELTATMTDYWVVKGYNRLSKSGGKLNEMHGGATLEESLVPFIIFERGKPVVDVLPSTGSSTIAQIVEKDYYDI